MLDLFELHSYFLKPSKCAFEQDHVTFLGFQIRAGCAQIDPVKMDGIRSWPEVFKNKKEICQFLGVVGFQQPFIRNFAKLALALTKLLKDVPWTWGDEQTHAVQMLKQAVCDDPELVAPNLSKPFELQTDASAFALGATLFQLDECGKKQMVGAASCTLMEMERNYDIWDWEFMGFVYGLLHWRHLLAGTALLVQVFVDHANLTHYRYPQKINRCIACYINSLSKFNYVLKHLPGTQNHANALSCRPDYDDGSNDNEQVIALPDHVFIHSVSSDSLWGHVAATQEHDVAAVQTLSMQFPLSSHNHHWRHSGHLIVVENNGLRREIVQQYHNAPTAGYPGVTSTLFSISQDYWWPKKKEFVQQYVRGCAICQANKADMTCSRPPLFPISPEHEAPPFSTIAIDWIMKLPMSQGYDLIMTITDHDVSKDGDLHTMQGDTRSGENGVVIHPTHSPLLQTPRQGHFGLRPKNHISILQRYL